jgi:hypothetical protein
MVSPRQAGAGTATPDNATRTGLEAPTLARAVLDNLA